MMRRFGQEDLDAYLRVRALPAGGEAICRRSWSATGPSRKVRSSRHHGSGRIASQKTGRSRDAESFAEYNVYKLFEYRKNVLWYAAQPADKVTRRFVTVATDGSVRESTAAATMDAFVFWEDRAPGWVDIKTRQEIDRQVAAHPGFYVLDGEEWRCPSADEYAAEWGLSYSVMVIDDLNPTEVANAGYIRAFLDHELAEAVGEEIRRCVAAHPGISVAELRQRDFLVDDICAAVLDGLIYIDLTKHRLQYQDVAYAYLDPTVAANTPAPLVVAVGGSRPGQVIVAVGEKVVWEAKVHAISAVGGSTIEVRPIDGSGDDAVILSRPDFDRAARSGAMVGLGPVDLEDQANRALIDARFGAAGPEAIERAEERLAALERYWDGEREEFPLVGGARPTLAAVRKWQTSYREFEETGCGFAGLVDRPQCGRPGSHLESAVQELIAEVSAEFFETPGRMATVKALHRLIVPRARAKGLRAPSYPAVLYWVQGQPRYAMRLKRAGHKGAAAIQPWAPFDPAAESPNGQFPNHVCHGDSTRADLWTTERFDREGSQRPSVFRLTEGFGKCLGRAFHHGEVDEGVVFEALADQIKRWGCLSEVYVLDSALTNKTTRLQKFLKKHGSDVKYRKTSSGRGGLPVERDFGALNTDVLHALRANTKISQNVRAMDRELDPQDHATWTLRDLALAVEARDLIVEQERIIPALGITTQAAWDARFEHGQRALHCVRWSDAVERDLSARHSHRPKVSNHNGIWVNRLYYWAEVFSHARLEGIQVEVLVIRWDIGSVWAYVPGHSDSGVWVEPAWVRCHLRSPLARQHVSYAELSFFTRAVLAQNAGDYRRRMVEDGRLGELLDAALQREAELEQEMTTIRRANGATGSKRLQLLQGDVLDDAPEPVTTTTEPVADAVVEGPVLSVVRTVAPTTSRPSISFGTSVRRRADDFRVAVAIDQERRP